MRKVSILFILLAFLAPSGAWAQYVNTYQQQTGVGNTQQDYQMQQRQQELAEQQRRQNWDMEQQQRQMDNMRRQQMEQNKASNQFGNTMDWKK